MNQQENLHTVLWDGDNTIWDWMQYAVPAYEAMCTEIAGIAGRSFNETADAMREFYSFHGTLEHEGLIQGLESSGFFRNVADFNREQTILQVQTRFATVRRQHLHVYPGIAKAMRDFHQEGVVQHILTDAPARQALARLSHSKLSPYIDTVFAMPSGEIKDIPLSLKKTSAKDAYQPRVVIVSEEKPHTNLERLLAMTRDQIARHVGMIGDNATKDMALGERYGMRGVHAAYGAATEDYVRRIQRFAPARVANRNMEAVGSSDNTRRNSRIVSVHDPKEIREQLLRM